MRAINVSADCPNDLFRASRNVSFRLNYSETGNQSLPPLSLSLSLSLSLLKYRMRKVSPDRSRISLELDFDLRGSRD